MSRNNLSQDFLKAVHMSMPSEVNKLEPQLMMRRPLADLEPLVLPDGVTIRHYEPGDAGQWEQIVCDAFGWEPSAILGQRFETIMRRDPAFRPQRVMFLCEHGKPVATTSAWHQPVHGNHTGTIHWVAVFKTAAGHGYGRLITLACLHRMKGEGRTIALLTTDDFRLPAIASYFKLNFEPCLVHENQRQRWRDVLTTIDKPKWLQNVAAILDGPLYEPPLDTAVREDLNKHDRYQRLAFARHRFSE